MKEVMVVHTIEVTKITKMEDREAIDFTRADREALQKYLKDTLTADDVLVTGTQIFERDC